MNGDGGRVAGKRAQNRMERTVRFEELVVRFALSLGAVSDS
jgi:hypothetical protein